MRFMIIVKGTAASEAGVMPEQRVFEAMADYHERLQQAGVLLDASGLQPSSKGWRIKHSGGTPTVIDGPFAEAKELVAGYTLIQVKSREEAMEWARRFPNPGNTDGEIEVRQLFELEDFQPSVGGGTVPGDWGRGEDEVAQEGWAPRAPTPRSSPEDEGSSAAPSRPW